jgi:hypothetical protein
VSVQGSASQVPVRALMDAFPAPVFIINPALEILDLNLAAAEFVGTPGENVGKRLCGNVLHCVSVHETEARCGHTCTCAECIVRRAVAAAAKGTRTVRRWTTMRLALEQQPREFCFLVSVSPIDMTEKTDQFLLILEDVTEIEELRTLLPICSGCSAVRADGEYWQSVQEYLRTRTAVRFTHGMCPECMERIYGDVGRLVNEGLSGKEGSPTPESRPIDPVA